VLKNFANKRLPNFDTDFTKPNLLNFWIEYGEKIRIENKSRDNQKVCLKVKGTSCTNFH